MATANIGGLRAEALNLATRHNSSPEETVRRAEAYLGFLTGGGEAQTGQDEPNVEVPDDCDCGGEHIELPVSVALALALLGRASGE